MDFVALPGYTPVIPPAQVIGRNMYDLYPTSLVDQLKKLSESPGEMRATFISNSRVYRAKFHIASTDDPSLLYLTSEILN